MAVIAGFGGRVSIGSMNLRAHHWSLDWKAEEHDITTFENFGYGGYIGGLNDVDVTFDAYFDTIDNPFTPPVTIIPGTYQAITINYVKGSATLTWTLPNVLCVTVHSETGVRDVIRYTYSGKFSGYNFAAGKDLGTIITPPVD